MYSDNVISWYSRRNVMYTKGSVEVSAVGAIPRNQDYENFTLIHAVKNTTICQMVSPRNM